MRLTPPGISTSPSTTYASASPVERYCRYGRRVPSLPACRKSVATVRPTAPHVYWRRGRRLKSQGSGRALQGRPMCPCGGGRTSTLWAPPRRPHVTLVASLFHAPLVADGIPPTITNVGGP